MRSVIESAMTSSTRIKSHATPTTVRSFAKCSQNSRATSVGATRDTICIKSVKTKTRKGPIKLGTFKQYRVIEPRSKVLKARDINHTRLQATANPSNTLRGKETHR